MSWMETGPPYSERTQTCLSFFFFVPDQKKRKSFLSGQLACWFANPDCSASDVQSTSRPTWRLHSRALTAPHVTTWHVGGGLSVRDVLQSSIAAADAARATVAVASRRHKQLDKGRLVARSVVFYSSSSALPTASDKWRQVEWMHPAPVVPNSRVVVLDCPWWC